MRGLMTGRAHIHIGDGMMDYDAAANVEDLSYGGARLGPISLTIKGNKQSGKWYHRFCRSPGSEPFGFW